jgi:hypothetical protein
MAVQPFGAAEQARRDAVADTASVLGTVAFVVGAVVVSLFRPGATDNLLWVLWPPELIALVAVSLGIWFYLKKLSTTALSDSALVGPGVGRVAAMAIIALRWVAPLGGAILAVELCALIGGKSQ